MRAEGTGLGNITVLSSTIDSDRRPIHRSGGGDGVGKNTGRELGEGSGHDWRV